MTLSETRKAIRELPDNLIYVDAAGSVQAADLKELEAAFGEIVEAVSWLNCPNAYGADGPSTFMDCGTCVVCVCRKEGSREDPPWIDEL